MDVLLWAGCIGAWLLFAGPIYQAAIELRDQNITRDDLEDLEDRLALVSPAAVNRWWWLVPPVAYVQNRRRNRKWFDGLTEAISADEYVRLQRYQNKANGWLIVACGALLVACYQTAAVKDLHNWSWFTYAVVLVVAFLASVGYTVYQLGQERRFSRVFTGGGADGADGAAGEP